MFYEQYKKQKKQNPSTYKVLQFEGLFFSI